MAGRCLAGRRALFSVAEALGGRHFIKTRPESGALGIQLAQNTHDQPIKTALLIAQGVADDLVRWTKDRFAGLPPAGCHEQTR
jgi:hypothetical protein